MSSTQGTWTCTSCGSWNAEWLDKCGNCNKDRND